MLYANNRLGKLVLVWKPFYWNHVGEGENLLLQEWHLRPVAWCKKVPEGNTSRVPSRETVMVCQLRVRKYCFFLLWNRNNLDIRRRKLHFRSLVSVLLESRVWIIISWFLEEQKKVTAIVPVTPRYVTGIIRLSVYLPSPFTSTKTTLQATVIDALMCIIKQEWRLKVEPAWSCTSSERWTHAWMCRNTNGDFWA